MEVQKMDLQKKLDFMEAYQLALQYRNHPAPRMEYEWLTENNQKEPASREKCHE